MYDDLLCKHIWLLPRFEVNIALNRTVLRSRVSRFSIREQKTVYSDREIDT